MKTYKNIYPQIISKENLALAFKKSSKGKSKKQGVIEFKKNLKINLEQKRIELLLNSYEPDELKRKVISDPKTRVIHISPYSDRLVQQAVVNILEPIFEPRFIYDSFANRKGKGTLKAIQRFDFFKSKVSKNNTKTCYVLKADIKHYFQEVNHKILLDIIDKKIKDNRVMILIDRILKNYSKEKGMPLGNQTSQFFQNIYLNELDQYIKHKLKAKYYLRYVDDFVILNADKRQLEEWKNKIKVFLKEKLDLDLHPNKSKIIAYQKGINFLGYRIFPYHKLLRKNNIRGMLRKLKTVSKVSEFLQGWFAYASHANTFNLRKRIMRYNFGML